jgi:hypothetical protein
MIFLCEVRIINIIILVVLPIITTSYSIIAYDVDINFLTVHNVSVVESITLHFPQTEHQFHHILSMKYPFFKNSSSYSHLKVSTLLPYKIHVVHQQIRINIGDSKTQIFGTQNYQLSYFLSSQCDMDRCQFNIIDFDWPIPIQNVTFSIHFSSPVNQNGFNLFTGSANTFINSDPHSECDSECEYSISGSFVRGRCLNLKKYHGIVFYHFINSSDGQSFHLDRSNVDLFIQIIFTILAISVMIVIPWQIRIWNWTRKTGNGRINNRRRFTSFNDWESSGHSSDSSDESGQYGNRNLW